MAGTTGTTTVSTTVTAGRDAVYAALVDPALVARWRFPAGMTCEVHAWDAHEGGTARVSLTYEDGPGAGKTTSRTDTYRATFARLVPGEQVVEVVVFESDDPAFAGGLRMTTTLEDTAGGTRVTVLHEGLPAGIRPEDDETGTRMALENLARLVADHG